MTDKKDLFKNSIKVANSADGVIPAGVDDADLGFIHDEFFEESNEKNSKIGEKEMEEALKNQSTDLLNEFAQKSGDKKEEGQVNKNKSSGKSVIRDFQTKFKSKEGLNKPSGSKNKPPEEDLYDYDDERDEKLFNGMEQFEGSLEIKILESPYDEMKIRTTDLLSILEFVKKSTNNKFNFMWGNGCLKMVMNDPKSVSRDGEIKQDIKEQELKVDNNKQNNELKDHNVQGSGDKKIKEGMIDKQRVQDVSNPDSRRASTSSISKTSVKNDMIILEITGEPTKNGSDPCIFTTSLHRKIYAALKDTPVKLLARVMKNSDFDEHMLQKCCKNHKVTEVQI